MPFNRQQHWNDVYQNKSHLEVSWYQAEPATSLEIIKATQVEKNQPIIDIGGGASSLVDHLQNSGYTNISVLDISTNALQHAKDRLGQDANKIEWHVTDVTEFEPPYKYSLWHDRAVFHFLTEQPDRDSYVKTVTNALSKGSHLVIAAFSFDGPTKCSDLDIVQYDAEKMQETLGDNFKLIMQQQDLHITPSAKEQSFNFFHFIRV